MLKNIEKDVKLKEKIQGAFWGAVLGDVIGAYLEFDKNVTKQKINQAFKLNGGGKHKLQPGQPTDDSQLNYAVCKGLIRGNEQMDNWFSSKPIDIGGTIRKSIPKACNMKVHQAHLCRKGAKQSSQMSQSNGSLMALIGLAIWCHKLSSKNIIQAIRQYTILIHPHQIVTLVNSFYTLMISFILKQKQISQPINIYLYGKKQINENKNLFDAKIFSEFQQWLQIIEKSFQNFEILTKQVPLQKNQGWIRIAFSYSIYFTVKQNDFKKTIQYLISNKGDTDTNACITGGILGTKIGISSLNMDSQIQKIKKWRPKTKIRPQWMVPGLILDKIINFLYQNSPTQLIIIGSQKGYIKNENK